MGFGMLYQMRKPLKLQINIAAQYKQQQLFEI